MYKLVFKTHIPDKDKKSCYDCYHCQAAGTWWCVNVNCTEWRGTSIPGGVDCPYWEPGLTAKDLSWFQKIFRSDLLFM